VAKRGGTRGRKSTGPGRTFYIVLGLVVAAGIVALFALRGGGEGGGTRRPVSVAELNAPGDSTAGIVAGSADAPVTLVEFADYTCPHCAEFTRVTGRALRQNYVETGKLRWVFFDFPLNQNSNAIPAALAARCAGDQGDFWTMHDLLFADQLDWVTSDHPESHFEDYAGQAGVDVGAWKKCFQDRTHLSRIMASRNYGIDLGVNATPTLFLNGQRVPPTDYDYGSLEKRIQAAAASASGGS